MLNHVRYEFDGGVATLWMNDGKANAMSVAMLTELNDALDRAEKEAQIVVLHGRIGGAFSGGFDLAVFKRGGPEMHAMLEAGVRLCLRLVDFPLPVISACTGHAVAYGALLLLASDLRVGIDVGARVHLSEVRSAMVLPHAAVALCQSRLSPTHLRSAATLGFPLAPATALKAGFLDELVSSSAMAVAIRRHCTDLLTIDTTAFTLNKRRINAPLIQAMSAAVEKDVADWNITS